MYKYCGRQSPQFSDFYYVRSHKMWSHDWCSDASLCTLFCHWHYCLHYVLWRLQDFSLTKPPPLPHFKTMSMLQQHKYHYIQIVFIAHVLALCIQQSKVVTAHLAAGPHSQGASTGVASLPVWVEKTFQMDQRRHLCWVQRPAEHTENSAMVETTPPIGDIVQIIVWQETHLF